MFKNLYNFAVLQVSLKPESALLIKGMEAPDPIAPDMAFIRTHTPKGEIVFIPGSSLKGVIRSFAESLLRSINAPGPEICDASNSKTMCPSVRKEKLGLKKNEKLPYSEHCLACRTFGSTDLASRVSFSDFMPVDAKVVMDSLTERPGVSINRKKGSVEHGPFQIEVVTKGSFRGTITLTNYQLWQMGLIIWTLELMDEGLIKLGYGKSRGPGLVHPTVEKVTIRQFGPLYNQPLSGVGQVENENKRGFLSPEKDIISDINPLETNGLWSEFNFEAENWQPVAQKIKDHFTQTLGG